MGFILTLLCIQAIKNQRSLSLRTINKEQIKYHT